MFDPIRLDEYGYIFDNTDGISITIYLFSGDSLTKCVRFNHGGRMGDFGFSLDNDLINDESKIDDFIIAENNLLYDSFCNLLGTRTSLLVDDDFTNDLKVKYLEIQKIGNNIVLEFVNNKEKQELSFEKYSISIKNTLRDLRSKIDQQDLDTKDRLWDFFSDSFKKLKNYSGSPQKTKS